MPSPGRHGEIKHEVEGLVWFETRVKQPGGVHWCHTSDSCDWLVHTNGGLVKSCRYFSYLSLVPANIDTQASPRALVESANVSKLLQVVFKMSAPIVTTISGTGATYSQSITTVSTDSHWTPVTTYTTVNNSPGTGKASTITKIVYSPLVSTFSIELGALGSPLSTLTPSTSTLSTSTLSTSTLSTSTSSTLNSSPNPLTTSFVSSGPSNSSTSVVVVPLTSTPASNSSSTQTGTPSPNSSSDTGAIAGAAVGCFIGGALIAGLLVWLFMSSRRKKKYRSSGGGFASQRQAPHGGSEKPLPLVAVAPVGSSGNWEKHLDQPESDATVTRSVKGLFDHIEVHVENFYRDANIPVTPELQAQLMKVDSHHLPDSVAGLLPQSQRPTLLIKHCIAQSIVEHISADSEIPDSFLPSDFIALPQALGARNSTGDKPGKSKPPLLPSSPFPC